LLYANIPTVITNLLYDGKFLVEHGVFHWHSPNYNCICWVCNRLFQ